MLSAWDAYIDSRQLHIVMIYRVSDTGDDTELFPRGVRVLTLVPVLFDVQRPLPLEVFVLVVIGEEALDVVGATCDHA